LFAVHKDVQEMTQFCLQSGNFVMGITLWNFPAFWKVYLFWNLVVTGLLLLCHILSGLPVSLLHPINANEIK